MTIRREVHSTAQQYRRSCTRREVSALSRHVLLFYTLRITPSIIACPIRQDKPLQLPTFHIGQQLLPLLGGGATFICRNQAGSHKKKRSDRSLSLHKCAMIHHIICGAKEPIYRFVRDLQCIISCLVSQYIHFWGASSLHANNTIFTRFSRTVEDLHLCRKPTFWIIYTFTSHNTKHWL